MATMYTWDPDTGMYVPSDTGTFVVNDAGAYVQSLSVTTDQWDYAPLSTATFTVGGVTAGDTLTFTVTDLYGNAVSGTDQPWSVTASVDGPLQTNWLVGADALGQGFLLTVTDANTGQTATTVFTDNHAPVAADVFFVPQGDQATNIVSTNGLDFLTGNLTTATGTGIFPSFVQIQASPSENGVEQGFNTDAAPVEDTGTSHVHNHSILVGDVPIVTVDGNDYREFRLDLNEPQTSDAVAQIWLEKFQLFTAGVGNLTSLTGATQIYDMDGGTDGLGATTGDNQDVRVLLQSWATGSGHSDYKVLVPVSFFSGTSATDFLYLYSQFSGAAGGFEEWSVGPTTPVVPPNNPDALLSLDKETLCGDTTHENITASFVKAGSPIIWEYTIQDVQGGTTLDNLVLSDDQLGTIYDHTNAAWSGTHFINPLLASSVTVTYDGSAAAALAVLDAGTLAFGHELIFDVSGTAVAGVYSNHNISAYENTATASGNNSVSGDTVGPVDFSSSYFGVDPEFGITKLTNGASNPNVISGQVIKWTYTVHNTGNVDLTDLVLTDNNGTPIPLGDDFHPTAVLGDGSTTADATHNIGDLNNDGLLNPGETWDFSASGTATATTYTNIVTVDADSDIGNVVVLTDGCGDSLSIEGTATSGYTGLAPALPGLTKGYWATHATLWDVVTGDEKGAGAEINVVPKYDWDHDTKTGLTDLSTVTTSGSSSSLGLVKGANNGGGDSGLLMGDLNHDGLVTGETSDHLFLDLASAQAVANSSVSGDARIILAGQAVAAQLNEYNDYALYSHDTSPNGLINEAVQWLKGTGLLSNGDSKLNFSTANDLTVPAVQAIIDDSAGQDYTISGGAITFKSASMPSSDASWNHFATVFTGYTPGTDSSGNPISNLLNFNTVQADGEGLKNALAAYNHGGTGTAGFVTSTDGSLIGWQDSLGGTVYDVHANTTDAFWGILEDQNLLGHTIVGVTGVHV